MLLLYANHSGERFPCKQKADSPLPSAFITVQYFTTYDCKPLLDFTYLWVSQLLALYTHVPLKVQAEYADCCRPTHIL